jgi:hypothetical protein
MKLSVKRPTCPYCHEEIEPAQPKVGCSGCMAWQHASCLRESRACAACSRSVKTADPVASGKRGRIEYQIFRSSWSSWETLFSDAAEFASWIGPEGLVSISHSADENDGVVTVWYRAGAGGAKNDTLRFQVTRGAWDSWESLFGKAGTSASGRRVVGISHSEDKNEGVVAVWYWS